MKTPTGKRRALAWLALIFSLAGCLTLGLGSVPTSGG